MNNRLFQILLKSLEKRTMWEKEVIAYFIKAAGEEKGFDRTEIKLYHLYETFFNKHEITKIYN